MDRLTLFRQTLRQIVNTYRSYLPQREGVDTVAINDDESGQYALLEIGWQYPHRVYNALFHARIKEGKIWVEQDWTKRGIIQDLLDAGIHPEDIEQGNIAPMLRASSELVAMRG